MQLFHKVIANVLSISLIFTSITPAFAQSHFQMNVSASNALSDAVERATSKAIEEGIDNYWTQQGETLVKQQCAQGGFDCVLEDLYRARKSAAKNLENAVVCDKEGIVCVPALAYAWGAVHYGVNNLLSYQGQLIVETAPQLAQLITEYGLHYETDRQAVRTYFYQLIDQAKDDCASGFWAKATGERQFEVGSQKSVNEAKHANELQDKRCTAEVSVLPALAMLEQTSAEKQQAAKKIYALLKNRYNAQQGAEIIYSAVVALGVLGTEEAYAYLDKFLTNDTLPTALGNVWEGAWSAGTTTVQNVSRANSNLRGNNSRYLNRINEHFQYLDKVAAQEQGFNNTAWVSEKRQYPYGNIFEEIGTLIAHQSVQNPEALKLAKKLVRQANAAAKTKTNAAASLHYPVVLGILDGWKAYGKKFVYEPAPELLTLFYTGNWFDINEGTQRRIHQHAYQFARLRGYTAWKAPEFDQKKNENYIQYARALEIGQIGDVLVSFAVAEGLFRLIPVLAKGISGAVRTLRANKTLIGTTNKLKQFSASRLSKLKASVAKQVSLTPKQPAAAAKPGAKLPSTQAKVVPLQPKKATPPVQQTATQPAVQQTATPRWVETPTTNALGNPVTTWTPNPAHPQYGQLTAELSGASSQATPLGWWDKAQLYLATYLPPTFRSFLRFGTSRYGAASLVPGTAPVTSEAAIMAADSPAITQIIRAQQGTFISEAVLRGGAGASFRSGAINPGGVAAQQFAARALGTTGSKSPLTTMVPTLLNPVDAWTRVAALIPAGLIGASLMFGTDAGLTDGLSTTLTMASMWGLFSFLKSPEERKKQALLDQLDAVVKQLEAFAQAHNGLLPYYVTDCTEEEERLEDLAYKYEAQLKNLGLQDHTIIQTYHELREQSFANSRRQLPKKSIDGTSSETVMQNSNIEIDKQEKENAPFISVPRGRHTSKNMLDTLIQFYNAYGRYPRGVFWRNKELVPPAKQTILERQEIKLYDTFYRILQNHDDEFTYMMLVIKDNEEKLRSLRPLDIQKLQTFAADGIQAEKERWQKLEQEKKQKERELKEQEEKDQALLQEMEQRSEEQRRQKLEQKQREKEQQKQKRQIQTSLKFLSAQLERLKQFVQAHGGLFPQTTQGSYTTRQEARLRHDIEERVYQLKEAGLANHELVRAYDELKDNYLQLLAAAKAKEEAAEEERRKKLEQELKEQEERKKALLQEIEQRAEEQRKQKLEQQKREKERQEQQKREQKIQTLLVNLSTELEQLKRFVQAHGGLFPQAEGGSYTTRREANLRRNIDNHVNQLKSAGLKDHELVRAYDELKNNHLQALAAQKRAKRQEQERLRKKYEEARKRNLELERQKQARAEKQDQELARQKEEHDQQQTEVAMEQERAWQEEISIANQQTRAEEKFDRVTDIQAARAAQLAETRLFFAGPTTTEDFVMQLLDLYTHISPFGDGFNWPYNTPAQWAKRLQKFIDKNHRAPGHFSQQITSQEMLDEHRLARAIAGLLGRLPQDNPDRQRMVQLLASIGVDEGTFIQNEKAYLFSAVYKREDMSNANTAPQTTRADEKQAPLERDQFYNWFQEITANNYIAGDDDSYQALFDLKDFIGSYQKLSLGQKRRVKKLLETLGKYNSLLGLQPNGFFYKLAYKNYASYGVMPLPENFHLVAERTGLPENSPVVQAIKQTMGKWADIAPMSQNVGKGTARSTPIIGQINFKKNTSRFEAQQSFEQLVQALKPLGYTVRVGKHELGLTSKDDRSAFRKGHLHLHIERAANPKDEIPTKIGIEFWVKVRPLTETIDAATGKATGLSDSEIAEVYWDVFRPVLSLDGKNALSKLLSMK